MDIRDFERLSEQEKRILIFEADKVTERRDDTSRYELFQIENFYVEVVTSLTPKSKRHIHTFSSHDLPVEHRKALEELLNF